MTPVNLSLGPEANPELRLFEYVFHQSFQLEPAGLWQAPGGMTLFGQEGDRFQLSIPVEWGVIAGARPRSDGEVRLRFMSRPAYEFMEPVTALGEVPDWAERVLDVVAALVTAGQKPQGATLLVCPALPEEFGLPVDGALRSAVAAAFEDLFGSKLSPTRRAEMGGLASQLASMGCPDNTALLVDTETLAVERLAFDLAAAGLRLMIVSLGSSDGSRPRRDPGASLKAADMLRRGDLEGLGALLNAHEGLSNRASLAVTAALEEGALGAGPLVSGSPATAHCVLALVPTALLTPVRKAVVRALGGPRAPRFLTATAFRGRAPLLAVGTGQAKIGDAGE